MQNKRGAILLEALLAIVVFTIIIFAVIPMLSFLLRRTERSKYEPQATILLQESQEIAYNIFTNQWNAYGNGQYHPAKGVKKWQLISGREENLQTRFTRTMTIKFACRDGSGTITNLDSATCVGIEDPNTRIITSQVTWEEAENTKSLIANLTLVNYE